MTPALFCSNCATPVDPGARFCSQCGRDVASEQAMVTTANVPTEIRLTDSAEKEMLAMLQHSVLGEYDIVGELGRGGMAIVYLAHEILLDRKVAIKVMAPTLLAVPGMAERFKREARTSAGLSHPHIIPIYTVRQHGALLFFVMKYVQGRGLDSIIDEEGALPIRMVRAILAHTGSALGYAHRHGVIHRDVKPANIMIDEEGFAVVTDFGIAKPSDAEELTATGALIGTPRYMSPEQCCGKPLTSASDQYSLGAVAYEMIAGTQPFHGDSLMEVMKKHLLDDLLPVEGLRPDCPPQLARAVNRMLAKDPATRWRTVEEAMAAAGAESLTADDPLRTRMVDLARSGKRQMELSRISTPRSPLPRLSEEMARSAAAATIPNVVAPAAARRTAVGAGGGRRYGRYGSKIALLLAVIITIGGGGWVAYRFGTWLSERQSASAVEQEQTSLPEGAGTLPVTPPTGADEPAVERPSEVEGGTIMVENLPPDGVVHVDGNRVEGTRITLSPGIHVVRLEARGYETVEETVAVQAGVSLTVRFARVQPRTQAQRPSARPAPPPTGFLGLAITNTQASVFLDDVDLGVMRRGVLPLTANVRHRLRLEREGFLTFDTTVVVTPGDTVAVVKELLRGEP